MLYEFVNQPTKIKECACLTKYLKLSIAWHTIWPFERFEPWLWRLEVPNHVSTLKIFQTLFQSLTLFNFKARNYSWTASIFFFNFPPSPICISHPRRRHFPPFNCQFRNKLHCFPVQNGAPFRGKSAPSSSTRPAFPGRPQWNKLKNKARSRFSRP